MARKDSQRIADRYVKALYDLAAAARAVDAVARDLAQFAGMIEQSSDLRAFLANPLLSRDQKQSGIEALAVKTKAHDLTRQFLVALAQNGRLEALAAIAAAFAAYVDAQNGVARAVVTSAVTLSDAQVKTVAAALEKATGRKVSVTARADASILGGLTIEMNGVMIDGSLSGKLKRLEQTLKSANAA